MRKAAAVRPVLAWSVPLPLATRPADGDPLGTVTYRSDGLRPRPVDLVAATTPVGSPSP